MMPTLLEWIVLERAKELEAWTFAMMQKYLPENEFKILSDLHKQNHYASHDLITEAKEIVKKHRIHWVSSNVEPQKQSLYFDGKIIGDFITTFSS